MRVHRHLDQHEAAEELPLLTESATVTAVEPMDRNRAAACLDELRRTLDEHGTAAWHDARPDDDGACDDFVGDRLDAVDHVEGGTPLSRYLPSDADDAVAEKVAALQARYVRPYPSLVRVAVETDDPVDFLPGQYLSVRYDGVTRPYSVASSPARNDIEFCVRRVPGGDLTPTLADHLSVGDEVTLRGPYGDLLLADPSPRVVVFLATGTGVAPFKSMVDYVFERGRDVVDGHRRDVWLFLGAAWEDDLAYREAFRSLDAERENFHFVPTCSRESYLTEWAGETAYVQYTLVKYLADDAVVDRDLPEAFDPYRDAAPALDVDARLDPASMDVYACGINAMVHGLVDAVEALGVPSERTRFEGFG